MARGESAFPIRVLLTAERSHAPVGPCVHVRTVVGRVQDESIFGNAELVEIIENLADIFIVIDHCVMVGRLPSAGLAQARLLRVGENMHVGEVEPYKKRRAGVRFGA